MTGAGSELVLLFFIFLLFQLYLCQGYGVFGAPWVLLFLLFVGVLLVRPCMFCLVGFLPSYPMCLAPSAGPGATAFL